MMSKLINKNPNFRKSFISNICTNSLAININNSPNYTKNDGVFTNHIDLHEILSSWNNSRVCTLKDAKTLHAHLIKLPSLSTDVFVVNSLIGWYLKLTAIDYAHKVFDGMPSPNDVTWNVMISGLNKNLLYNDAWGYFCRRWSMGYGSSQYTYGSVISACGGLGSVLYGKLIYSLTLKDGFFSNGYVRSGMIDLFAKNGSFEDAFRVFCDWPFEENVVCWNSIISGVVKSGDHGRAVELFDQMRRCQVFPNSFTFSGVLTACIALGDVAVGKKVHGLVIKHGAGHDVFVGTSISDLYSRCGAMDEATKNFLRMPVQNVVSWTSMISRYVQKNDVISAINLFREMRKLGFEVNKYTITSLLSACSKLQMIDLALQMHSWILKSHWLTDSAVRAALINTYSKLGEVCLAELLSLEKGDSEDVSVLTAMICSFVQSNKFEKAISLFRRILLTGLKPDNFSISSILSITNRLEKGRQMHSYVLKTGFIFDLLVGSSLFTMYSKCGQVLQSYEIFVQLPDKDIVSWGSMISGFAEHGYSDKAMQLFREMLAVRVRPDQVPLVGLLTACSSQGSLIKGKEVHGYAFRVGFSQERLIGGALVNMYAKCGALDSSRRVFDMVPKKDNVMCSALVSGYARNGNIRKALHVLRQMLLSDLPVDYYTLSSILGSHALLSRPDIGIQLHALVVKLGLQFEVSVGSALISMYSKTGAVKDCRNAFDEIVNPDLIGWTTMIVSYAQHGKGEDALKLYEAMQSQGVKPDIVTFVGVLSACSHTGLVGEGYYHLRSMSEIYGIEPGLCHYACMVDLLGRSGRLKEAESFINNMPVEPDGLIWGTLLAYCKLHGDVELGKIAAEKVFQLEPNESGAYVSLSNICADLGQWEEVEEIRKRMKGNRSRLSKEPGWSHA
ncbi:pentatricopeptide repeat-containing protein At1g74600, chloroplastic [Silene latifolia]|uniref:pentatricopeptide repeat-containing protein At1g74600, chloroplastic n=1 Tax=Silene latifolia TaxID=37657 RepID=UPI003D777839